MAVEIKSARTANPQPNDAGAGKPVACSAKDAPTGNFQLGCKSGTGQDHNFSIEPSYLLDRIAPRLSTIVIGPPDAFIVRVEQASEILIILEEWSLQPRRDRRHVKSVESACGAPSSGLTMKYSSLDSRGETRPAFWQASRGCEAQSRGRVWWKP